MRTLFVAERFPPFPGGVAASAARIARAVAAAWGPVTVIALDPGRPAGAVSPGEEAGLPVVRIGAAGPREAMASAALRQAATVPAEVVFGHFAGNAGFLAVLHARLSGTRSAVSIRGNDLDRGMLGDDGFARLLWTLRHADEVAAVTTEHARKAAALAGRDEVRWTPNVLDAARLRLVPAEVAPLAGLAPGDEAIGFAGELRPRKGLHALLGAVARLAVARPRVRLLLVGGVHPAAGPAFAAALREHPGLAARIVEVPYDPDPDVLATRLAACRVMAFPSLAEGLPNALLEAMAAARPCVASAVGGALDVIEDRQSGLLVPPGDPEALALAIEALLDDPARARALGLAARERVERCFGPARESADLGAMAVALGRPAATRLSPVGGV